MENQHSFMLVMWGNNALINKNREIKLLFSLLKILLFWVRIRDFKSYYNIQMQSKLTMHPIRNDFNAAVAVTVAVAVDAITIGHICHILPDFQVAQFIVP